MFPWQSNSSTRDPATMNDDEDAPETPAHIFPVRAFKHAIFGTPAAPKTDRKPARQRPQSSHGTSQTRDKELLSNSPAKAGGILRTPGTGGQKRKSVSFGGAGQRSYEEAIGARLDESTTHAGAHHETSQPSNFARKLRESKEQSAASSQGDVTLDMDAPRSVSGNYWKSEFESYSANTERQLKKLAKKEQVAKKYAQVRDGAASQLEEDLQREQLRAQELERKVDDFRRRLENALQGTGKLSVTADKDTELDRLRKENEKLRSQLRAQWQSQTEAKMSAVVVDAQSRSPSRPSMSRATTAPTKGAAADTPIDNPQSSSRRDKLANGDGVAVREDSRKDQQKETSDIWADVGSATDKDHRPASPVRQTPRRRLRDREPLAQRNENAESRSSSAAATLGTKPSAAVPSEKEISSRSSSTAATLGSKRPSIDTIAAHQTAANAQALEEEHKRTEMTSERQAAARKRLEERKKAKQRAAVAA